MNLSPDILRQNAAAMLAHADGKPVEVLGSDGWIPTKEPRFDCYTWQYRPAPWKLPEPPAGKRWHRDDFTEADLPEGWRPLLLGEPEQKEDQCFVFDEWHDDPVRSTANESDNKRRTLRPLPAEPKVLIMAPWDSPEDVPPVCWIRYMNNDDILMITGVCTTGVHVFGTATWDWDTLKECKYSTDRKTWHPCTKEVRA